MAEDYTDYITQGAIAQGLDPKAALRTVDTEGGRSGKVGDSGTSFGPFQMHVGGTAPGTTAKGLGDAMLAQGLDPKNPYQSIDFALDYAKAHGGTFSPDIWHGLRGGGSLAPGEHRWVGAPIGGGGQPLYLGTLEKNFHDTGNDLLDALLAQNYPKEDKPTGNGLLDQIMQQAVYGLGPPNQAQPAPDAAKALWQSPLALPPQTVPELSGQQVDIKSMQPLQQAAMPMPGSQSQEYGREGLTPPNVRGPEPTPPPIPIPGSQDHNRFFTPNEVAPYNPPGVPDDRQQQAATGNGLLDRILKQLSPISTAQAAEPPAAPQPVPTTPATPTPIQPPPAASPAIAPQTPTQQFIEPPAKGQQVPPPVQPRAALPAPQAQPGAQPQRPVQVGKGLASDLITQSIGQLLDTFVGQPLQQAQRGISGQDEPGTPQAIEDAMAGAQLASAGSIGRGGMGAGPRLPERIEPPPMRFTEAAREAPSEPLAPGHTGQQLVVARRMPSGEIRYGQPGQTHADLIDPDEMLKSGEPWFPPPDQTMGFAQPGGPFMSRDEALAFVRRNEPARAVTAHEPTGLQAEQYQREAPSGPLALPKPESAPSAQRPGAPQGLPVPPRVPGAEMGSASRTEPGTALRPFAGGGGGPPAIPPTGVARVPGGEPPPEQPDLWRESRSTVDEPRPPRGDANESGPVKQMRLQAMHSTQDQLFKLWSSGNAYINKFLRQFASLPRLSAEENLQVERYLEWQPGMPQVSIGARAKRIADEVIKPARERAAEDFKWLRDHDATEHLAPEHEEDLTEGYLHRMRAPTGGERHPFDPFAGRKGLRQSTAAQKQRKWFVVQDMAGNRHIYRGDAPPPNTPIYQDSVTGKATFQEGANNRKIGEVRRATTEEVEKNTDTRFVHDPVLATLQSMTQLHLARENVALLQDKLLPELTDQGLVVTDRRAAQKLSTVPGRPWRETNVPALRGHYFEPRLADAFDDFYRTPSIISEDLRGLSGLFTGLNRVAINTLFLNPFGHMRNVTADALLARGHLWFDPLAYPGFAQTMRTAFKDVWNRSPFYYQVMKAGGSTMGAAFENRILYQALADRAKFEMTKLPHFEEIAQATGVWPTAKAMGEAIWNASQKFMWGYHDMLLMQNVREQIMRNPNLSLEQAVMKAERFIADYRVPATVEGREGSRLSLPQPQARTLSRWMQDRSITVFGRYHYNKLKAIAGTIRDVDRALTRGGIPASQRLEAAGRLGAMLVWSNILMYGLTAAVRTVSGNPNAQVHVPGALGIPANTQKVAQDLFQGQLGQAGWDAWMTLASIITPVPALMEAGEQMFNRSYPGGPEIRGTQLPAGKQALQTVAHGSRALLPPVGDLLDWRRGLESTTGIRLPPATARPPGTPYINKRDRTRQNRAYTRQMGRLGGLGNAPTFGIPPEPFVNPK